MQRALDIVNIVKEIGYKGAVAYAMRDRESLEYAEEIADICFLVAGYFRMWLDDEIIQLDRKINDLYDITGDGVYYFSLDLVEESHAFVLLFHGDKITYCGGYGGVCKVVVEEFDAEEYKEIFANAMRGSLEDYEFVFDVDAAIDSITFISLHTERSKKY